MAGKLMDIDVMTLLTNVIGPLILLGLIVFFAYQWAGGRHAEFSSTELDDLASDDFEAGTAGRESGKGMR